MPIVRSGALLRIVVLGALALPAACGGGGSPGGLTLADVAAQVPPVLADRARFFFYRDYEPYESLGRPYVTLNAEIAGIS
jgi:hypothetical protein